MITVLLCVYNGERWLRECIQSILNQTYKNFEFLIINDGNDLNNNSSFIGIDIRDNKLYALRATIAALISFIFLFS